MILNHVIILKIKLLIVYYLLKDHCNFIYSAMGNLLVFSPWVIKLVIFLPQSPSY